MSRLSRLLLGLVPWTVIAGLLTAAFYIEPTAVGEAVTPPPIVPQDRFYGAAYVNPNAIWLAGNLGKIVHSGDGGRTWAVQETPAPYNLQSIAAWDHANLIAVGDQGIILRTADGGGTWQKVPVDLPGIANKLIRVRVLDDGSGWIVGEFGMVLASHDRGRTWRLVSEPQDITLHDIAGYDGLRFAVGEFGTVLYSEDFGDTWEERMTPAAGTLNSIDFQNGGFGVAVGLDGVILLTSDGGAAWREIPSPTEEHLFVVRWTGSGWLVLGDRGTVLESDPSAENWSPRSLALWDHAWRTEAVATNDHWLLVGAVSGFYRGDDWRPIVTNRGRGP